MSEKIITSIHNYINNYTNTGLINFQEEESNCESIKNNELRSIGEEIASYLKEKGSIDMVIDIKQLDDKKIDKVIFPSWFLKCKINISFNPKDSYPKHLKEFVLIHQFVFKNLKEIKIENESVLIKTSS